MDGERTKQETPGAAGYRMPAEFERHRGCLMIWPQRPGSWPYGAENAKKVFAEIAKQQEAAKRPKGRQSVRKLMNHHGGKNAMKYVGAPKDFDRIAKEFHVDYAFHKTGPGHYLLFFKADQADAIQAAFGKYTEKVMGRSQDRPSILGQLRQFVEQIAARPKQKEQVREAVKEER